MFARLRLLLFSKKKAKARTVFDRPCSESVRRLSHVRRCIWQCWQADTAARPAGRFEYFAEFITRQSLAMLCFSCSPFLSLSTLLRNRRAMFSSYPPSFQGFKNDRVDSRRYNKDKEQLFAISSHSKKFCLNGHSLL